MTADARTPTEDRVLDTLGALPRLGESMWTFNARLMPSLHRLEGKGLVHLAHGVTERTARAGLTKAARDIALPGGYVAPIFQDPNPWQKWPTAGQDSKHTCWWCIPAENREEGAAVGWRHDATKFLMVLADDARTAERFSKRCWGLTNRRTRD